MSDEELIQKYIPLDNQKKSIERLNKGEPIQYILGNVIFAGYDLKVNKSVLIPRFETEFLCAKLKKYIKDYFDYQISIADLGTGSGAIGIYLQKELNCLVTGFDISSEALKIAKDNAQKNNAQITFINHNIKTKIPGKYDVIVSNPPYIKKGTKLPLNVNYEPKLALYGDETGIDYYISILDYAQSVLNKKNIIAFEIGYDEGESIINYAKTKFPLSKIVLEKDLNGFDRYIFIFN